MKHKFKKSLSLILAGMMFYSLVLFVSPSNTFGSLNGTSISQTILKPCEDPPAL